jgi:Holliday junction resolvase
MSKGPESNFWKQIRNNLPEKCFATRIENKHGGGVPDVHMVWDGKAFWFELKVTKGNAVNISPQQVAWNMAYYARGGSNFYLVKRAVDNHLFLFGGDQGPSLSQSGISGAEGHDFADLAALWNFLAARLAARGAAFISCGSTGLIKTARV